MHAFQIAEVGVDLYLCFHCLRTESPSSAVTAFPLIVKFTIVLSLVRIRRCSGIRTGTPCRSQRQAAHGLGNGIQPVGKPTATSRKSCLRTSECTKRIGKRSCSTTPSHQPASGCRSVRRYSASPNHPVARWTSLRACRRQWRG